MKRVLIFEGEKAARRYTYIYEGFVIGGQRDEKKSFDVVRKEAKILDKLQAAGVVQDGDGIPGLGDKYTLNPESSPVVLTQPEHDLVKARLEATPWRTHLAPQVVDAVDWFCAAPQEEGEA